MFKEFKDFAMRGNVLDMAVGIIIGGAFGKIVSSFVNDVIMPPIGMLMGNVDFGSLFINLSGTDYASLAAAEEAGAAVIATLSNIGPGLGSVGPVDNFAHVPDLGKLVLALCMLLGRLELYTVLVLVFPTFWRK